MIADLLGIPRDDVHLFQEARDDLSALAGAPVLGRQLERHAVVAKPIQVEELSGPSGAVEQRRLDSTPAQGLGETVVSCITHLLPERWTEKSASGFVEPDPA